MKTKILYLTFFALLAAGKSNAQLQNLFNKAKTKAQGITNSQPAKKADPPASSPGDYDFQPGDSVLFNETFSAAATGSMPVSWKTNGSGKVITIPDIGGKWLKLQNGATYKLSKQLNLPPKFTIEFDVVAMADKTTDLDPLIFGFTKDNSITSYIQDAYNNGGIATVTLLYFNSTQVINVSSSKTRVYFNTDFGLSSYANIVMHVSIAGDGDHVTIYLDKTKIADTNLFKSDPAKYVFISAPLSSKNNAAIAIGNFNVKTFKK